MTASGPSPLRVIAFGDIDGEVWGSAIDPGTAADSGPAIAFGTPDGDGAAIGAEAVSLTETATGWTLDGEGFDLRVEPAAHEGDADASASGALHRMEGALCRVEGALAVGGVERAVQGVGTWSTGTAPRSGRVESARSISGWFAPDRGLTVLALRPGRGTGHGSDLVTAAVFDPDGWIEVDEPRLSTTFAGGDRPSRASLELWIGDGEEQYPRRAAAEASGDPAVASGGGVSLQVTPIRCHSGGLDGAGVYVLARF
jgi:hypothetical protein